MWQILTVMKFRRKIKAYTQAPMSHHVVMETLAEYKRPNDKISDLLKNGALLSLRKGLYISGPETDLPTPDLFVIANHLRGPSYISLETALSYWGLIPERVREISSVTLKTTKVYTTPIGRFSFRYVASPYYSFGLEQAVISSEQVAIIASREKAICDKIVLTSGVNLRSIRQTIDFLVDDLRIDQDLLAELDHDRIASWIEDAPKRSSLSMFVKTLRSL